MLSSTGILKTVMMRIAIDTGGTFTDCVYAEDGQLRILKIPSTPADPGNAVAEAVEQIAKGKAADVRHGTTVGTNALLERNGARTCFVTTAGFEDSLSIGRQTRPHLYDWTVRKEPPLVPEQRCFGVDERTGSDGSVLAAVTAAELERIAACVKESGAESVAVSLLFSFVNSSNERAVVETLRSFNLPVSAAYEILPEFREYERGSTVVMNAYLAPRMHSYLTGLERVLSRNGSSLYVMQSSGGIIAAEMAAREPVRTILSGPAGGVIGAAAVARAAGLPKILTFDMGGTSTDVALVDLERGLTTTSEYKMTGMPVAIPVLDIHTVGAGGGSLAWFNQGGVLEVGPQSAGADPGPVCYGKGTAPTVTDADLVLGRLDPDLFLGGKMRLHRDRTMEELARRKGSLKNVDAFAEGIVTLANARMEQALRRISVERGFDPREFTLVTFGGAGPLHACALAQALRIPEVLIPRFPGALSAYGILVADIVRDYSRTVMLRPEDEAIERHIAELESHRESGMVSMRSLDMRYRGQGYEIAVPFGGDVVEQFHALHERQYGYADRARPVEVVNVRVRLVRASEPLPFPAYRLGHGDGRGAVLKSTTVTENGSKHEAKVYDRDRLQAGDRFEGPALVTEYSATSYLPLGCEVAVDKQLNLRVKIQ
jgi:N-methylhydantoinase A